MEGPGAEEVPQAKVWAPPLQYVATTTIEVTSAARLQHSEDRGYVRLFPLQAMNFGVRVAAPIESAAKEPGV